MQLNIYVPKTRQGLLQRLDELSSRSGRAKNEIVLEAIEAYVCRSLPQLGAFHLGEVLPVSRGELYEARLDRT